MVEQREFKILAVKLYVKINNPVANKNEMATGLLAPLGMRNPLVLPGIVENPWKIKSLSYNGNEGLPTKFPKYMRIF